MNKNNKDLTEEEIDDLLEQQWSKQEEIHKVCKMKDKNKQMKKY